MICIAALIPLRPECRIFPIPGPALAAILPGQPIKPFEK
jgi:hypothetical protein